MTTSIILAVDDSPSMRGMIAYLLRQAGYEVLEATTARRRWKSRGRGAWTWCSPTRTCRTWTGSRWSRACAALPEYKRTPILMLTTESSSAMKERGRAAGATGWMVKPFDPERLVDMLRKVLGPRAPRSA
jgi:two-component system chemotaxis response regulator CheY